MQASYFTILILLYSELLLLNILLIVPYFGMDKFVKEKDGNVKVDENEKKVLIEFNEKKVDEIIVLDIAASKKKLEPKYDMIEKDEVL